MNKSEYDQLVSLAHQTMANASLIAEQLKAMRCGILADQALSCCTTMGCIHDKLVKIEPDWNCPDTSDCHTHS